MNRSDRRHFWRKNHKSMDLGTWSEWMETQIVHGPRVLKQSDLDKLGLGNIKVIRGKTQKGGA